jgi:hypothetical protein
LGVHKDSRSIRQINSVFYRRILVKIRHTHDLSLKFKKINWVEM